MSNPSHLIQNFGNYCNILRDDGLAFHLRQGSGGHYGDYVEQKRIVAEVERRLSVVEELEAVVNANLQRTTRFRQSILHLAFKGKL